MLKFLNDLNDVLRPIVRMTCPTTVEQAAERERVHETALEAMSRKHKRQPTVMLKAASKLEVFLRLLRP